jgi:phosphatidate cytidylyltransferase
LLYKRILSAAVGIPVILLAAWYGGWAHFVLTALVMVFSLFELNKMYCMMGVRPLFPIMITGVLILLISAYQGGAGAFSLALIPVVGLFLLSAIARFPAQLLADVAVGLAGTLYIGLFTYFYLLRTLEEGLIWVLFMLAGTWASDTAAYFVGKKIGKRKLAPRLSPGKTVEGALGGITGSIMGSFLIYLFFPVCPPVMVLVLGLTVGIFGLLGDLFESSLKRTAGIKDTGFVIPGHGGVLDRFDSMIFTAPAVYYCVTLLIKG